MLITNSDLELQKKDDGNAVWDLKFSIFPILVDPLRGCNIIRLDTEESFSHVLVGILCSLLSIGT